MNRTEFNKELEKLFNSIKDRCNSKGEEYAEEQDVFANFIKGGKVANLPPEVVLDGYLLKHYVSYRDMLCDIFQGNRPHPDVINEKLGDIILYFILQKIMMEENQLPW